MELLVLCTASVPLVALVSHVLQPLADAHRRLPPGPRPLPVVGNLLDVGKEYPHRSLARLARRHGPLMSVRLDAVYAVVATSPEAAREVLQRKNATLAARRGLDAWRVMGHDANSVIALPPRGKWHALRKLAAAGLVGPRRLAEQAAVREEKVRELVRRVASGGDGSGAPVAVARVAFAAVVGVLCQGMFSEELEPAMVDELTDVVVEASVLSGAPNVSDFYPALAVADLQGIRRRAGTLVSWLYKLVDGQIERRLARRRRMTSWS